MPKNSCSEGLRRLASTRQTAPLTCAASSRAQCTAVQVQPLLRSTPLNTTLRCAPGSKNSRCTSLFNWSTEPGCRSRSGGGARGCGALLFGFLQQLEVSTHRSVLDCLVGLVAAGSELSAAKVRGLAVGLAIHGSGLERHSGQHGNVEQRFHFTRGAERRIKIFHRE